MAPANDLAVSVILPAYNEARRLPPYLTTVRAYLDQRYPDQCEVLVVDDGSNDGLQAVVESFAADWPALRCLRHAQNRGKGAAVRTGVLAARGARVLFADADGAAPIAEESRLTAALDAGADLAIGSRLAPATEVQRLRGRVRGLAGRCFAALARRALRLSFHDTQCGFKMFRREAAHRLFTLLSETGYLFDLELLALANRLGYRVAEVPIHWQEVPGGHLSLARELPRVLIRLWRLRRRLASNGVRPA